MQHYPYIIITQTEAEYAEKILTYQKADYEVKRWKNKVAKVTMFVPPKNAYWPEQIDWRTRDAVSPVKDQVHRFRMKFLVLSMLQCRLTVVPVMHLHQWGHWKVLIHWHMANCPYSVNKTSLTAQVAILSQSTH